MLSFHEVSTSRVVGIGTWGNSHHETLRTWTKEMKRLTLQMLKNSMQIQAMLGIIKRTVLTYQHILFCWCVKAPRFLIPHVISRFTRSIKLDSREIILPLLVIVPRSGRLAFRFSVFFPIPAGLFPFLTPEVDSDEIQTYWMESLTAPPKNIYKCTGSANLICNITVWRSLTQSNLARKAEHPWYVAYQVFVRWIHD